MNVIETLPVSSPVSTETAVPPTHTSDSPGEVNSLTGKIAYSTEGDVYVINADGSGRTRLTDDTAEDFDPVWSPDGTQLAFRSHRDENEEVYVMNADSSNQHNISNAPGGDYSPAWSPDGTKILYQQYEEDRSDPEIFVMMADGTGQVNLTNNPGTIGIRPGRRTERKLSFTRNARKAGHCIL